MTRRGTSFNKGLARLGIEKLNQDINLLDEVWGHWIFSQERTLIAGKYYGVPDVILQWTPLDSGQTDL